MVTIVKFDSAENRVAFNSFLDEAMGLRLRMAKGAKNGWVIDSDDSLSKAFDYLHGLGAFKWYDED